MDLKTLEYLEKRAGEARKLVTEIDMMQKCIEDLSNLTSERFGITCRRYTSSWDLCRYIPHELINSDILPVIIATLEKHRDHLQAQLDQL